MKQSPIGLKKEVGSEKPSIHITNALGFSFAIYLGRSPSPAIRPILIKIYPF